MALDEPGLEGETPNARSASTSSSAKMKVFTERMPMLRFLVYHRIARRVRSGRGDEDVWSELAEELERAAAEREEEAEDVEEALT